MNNFKPNDIVHVINCNATNIFYSINDIAVLIEFDPFDGLWLADFSLRNKKYFQNGQWWISTKNIKLIEKT